MKDNRVMSLIATLRRDLERASDDLKSLQNLLVAIDCLDEVAKSEPQVNERHRDCVSLQVPEGYATVLGYLAGHHPEVLDLMDYSDPSATERDGFWLAHRFKNVVYVPAPPVLRQKGILRVRAWPLELLAHRFGDQ